MKTLIKSLLLTVFLLSLAQAESLPFETKSLFCREKISDEESLPEIAYELKCDFYDLAQSINLKGCQLTDAAQGKTHELELEHQNYSLGFLFNDELKAKVNVTKLGTWGSIRFADDRFFECLQK